MRRSFSTLPCRCRACAFWPCTESSCGELVELMQSTRVSAASAPTTRHATRIDCFAGIASCLVACVAPPLPPVPLPPVLCISLHVPCEIAASLGCLSRSLTNATPTPGWDSTGTKMSRKRARCPTSWKTCSWCVLVVLVLVVLVLVLLLLLLVLVLPLLSFSFQRNGVSSTTRLWLSRPLLNRCFFLVCCWFAGAPLTVFGAVVDTGSVVGVIRAPSGRHPHRCLGDQLPRGGSAKGCGGLGG